MCKKTILAAVFAVFFVLILFPLSASAFESWEEEFKNSELVDLTQSDAYVYINPIGGFVELPAKKPVGALELREESYDQVILSSAGLEYFMFNGGEMIKNPFLSYPESGSAVAVRQDSYSAWIATDKEISRLEFDGTEIVENPFLKITGKSNIMSISSQPYDDEVAVLIKNYTGGGLLEYYALSGSSMEKLLSFELPVEFGSPVDISVIPGKMDIVYATESAVIYYHFDGVGYIQNPFLSVTALSNIKGLFAYEGGFAILRADRKEHYLFTGENMAYIEALSINLPSSAVSLALKPNSYDFAVLDETGMTRYYKFDNGYVQEVSLSAHGSPIETGYYTPRRYVSKAIQFSEEPLIFALEANEDKPTGTDIKYCLKIDSEELEIVPGIPLTLEDPVQTLTLIAELSTESNRTPKITKMKLLAYKLGIKYIKMDMFPIYPDFEQLQRPFKIYPVFPDDFPSEYLVSQNALLLPIPVQIGSVIVFELETFGNPDKVTMNLECREGPLYSDNLLIELSNIGGSKWVGILNIPEETPEGSEYKLVFVELEGASGTIEIPSKGYMHNPFLLVGNYPEMNLLNYFKVYLTR